MYLRIDNISGITSYCYNNYTSVPAKEKNVKIFLKGIVLNSEKFAEFNDTLNIQCLYKLNGSFNILIINHLENNSTKITFLTDVVNSRKLFYKKSDQGFEISDDLNVLIDMKSQLNEKAVACYLANGNMLDSMTLFNEIDIAEGGCIYTISDKKINKTKYWDVNFNYTNFDQSKLPEYKLQFKELLFQSIEKRVKVTNGKILVSLSAGYDARSILGFMKKYALADSVSTFTYSPFANPTPGSDAYLSEKISAGLGCDHIGIQSFNGSFIELLKWNAHEGKCIAPFCDELEAIKKMAKLNKYSDVFVGDEWFGRLDVPLKTDMELLDSVSIVGSWGVQWLSEFLANDTFNNIVNNLNLLTNKIISETEKFNNAHDKKDFLYLHQRVNHVNLTWREYFTSQIGTIHNPYLDCEILDFYKKIPPELRIEKTLFIDVITELIPEIFTIPIADDRKSLTGINLRTEIINNRNELTNLLLTTNSRLDQIIQRDEILKAIQLLVDDRQDLKHKLFKLTRKGINAVRRKYKFADRLLFKVLGSRTVKVPGKERLVLRLLLLWIYLIEEKTN